MYNKQSSPQTQYGGSERKFDLGRFIQDQWMPQILSAINESNPDKYHTLVEELDVTLDPFHDELYRKQLKFLKDIKDSQLKTGKEGQSAILHRFYREWRRLIMNLMARENLMRQEDGVLDET